MSNYPAGVTERTFDDPRDHDTDWSPRCIECDGETQHSKRVSRHAGSHYDEFACVEDGCGEITTVWNEG